MPLEKKSSTLKHFLRGNLTPPKWMPDAVYGRHVFDIDLLRLNPPKWIPYDALGDQLKNIFCTALSPQNGCSL
jgi:hypothetical protein